MKFSLKIREEELKNKVAAEYFAEFDATKIIGNIDFCIARSDKSGQRSLLSENAGEDVQSVLWAESKKGNKASIHESLVQLILTIGKARAFDSYLPPHYLGAFDAEKIAFIPYNSVMDVFYQNDFNWNVTPSDHGSKEFQQLFDMVRTELEEGALLFYFDGDDSELRAFIRRNLGKGGFEKIQVNKNNFVTVYGKWEEAVKPSIAIDWAAVKKMGIISADFFLADLLSEQTESGAYRTIIERLFVLLNETRYELDRKLDAAGFEEFKTVHFNDRLKAYKTFWAKYQRPPKEEYWSYIVERRDLLVPQDIRERKGSFFTPQKWVELSQKYLADVLGENWQDEYYVWDCSAGTGNLLNGLTNKRNIWASTLDKADVEVIRERIANGANLFEDHVFQFDFLNDGFEKLPPELKLIIDSEDERKKLVIYINPPYAEAATTRTKTGTGGAKAEVARNNNVFEKYGEAMGGAANEIFAEFLIRINAEIQCCKVAHFATLKALCAPNFAKFRALFGAVLKSLFVVPANTFDNVNGKFPIGFFILDTAQKREERPLSIEADVYDRHANPLPTKIFYEPPEKRLLMDWLKTLHDKENERIAYLRMLGSDMQNNGGVFITLQPSESDIKQRKTCDITRKNFLNIFVYFAVRLCIEPTWLNDRDQFLFPNDGWKTDRTFQSDCLIFTLFHGQNRITETPLGGSNPCGNHFIPFTEEQVGSKKSFSSHFMSDFLRDFLAGKITVSPADKQCDLFADGGVAGVSPAEGVGANGKAIGAEGETSPAKEISLSPAAQAVYDAGLELWRYYHSKQGAKANASFYDIRAFFQGTRGGRMNSDSDDSRYTALIADLRQKQKRLAAAIAPKVYEYGFLR